MRILFACAASLALISCAGGPGQGQRLERVANPSEVVATELAFARAANEDGQWTAFRKYAADGALIFGRSGAFEAKPWLAKQTDPQQSVTWEPTAVWSSCDGTLAVSAFSFADPNDNTRGMGHTVWAREKNGEYRWLFDFGWPTDVAPAQSDMISAKVAECGPVNDVVGDQTGLRRSADGTLAWNFAFTGEGTRNFTVWTAGPGGSMTPVIEVAIPPSD
jgi:hypothetical protein